MVINIAPVLSVFIWLAVSLHPFVKMITVPSCAHDLFYCLAAHTHNKLVLWSFSLHKTTIWDNIFTISIAENNGSSVVWFAGRSLLH